MKKFVGDFKAKVDDKGRLVFPSAFKAAMEGESMMMIVKKDSFDPCLSIYPYAEWERKSAEVKARLNLYKPEHSRLWRAFMSHRASVEPDPKLGRITIPQELLAMVGIIKDVVFMGQDDKIELWAAETADAASAQPYDEAGMTENILGKD